MLSQTGADVAVPAPTPTYVRRHGNSSTVAATRLERRWPGSTRHVALTDDGLGYDLAFSCRGRTLHLEVKTTGRRGRLVLYLSRHEHEVALLDPDWRWSS